MTQELMEIYECKKNDQLDDVMSFFTHFKGQYILGIQF
jgi:hypothetical protein